MFARLATYFHSLTRQGLGRGYYYELSKSVLIVRPENIEAGKVFGAHHGFKVCMGARYLRGLYLGRVQTRLVARAYAEVVGENQHDQRNCR